MPYLPSKRTGGLLIGLGVIGLAISMPSMVSRLQSREIPIVWFDDTITDEQFSWMGKPVVVTTVYDTGTRVHYGQLDNNGYPLVELSEHADPNLPARIEIFWRNSVITQPFVGQFIDKRLPVLLKHEDWLRIALMVEGAQSRTQLESGIADGSLHPRMIVSMRLPPEGYDPDTWGKVRRKDWRYRFIELLPPGSGDQTSREFGGTYGELDALGNPDERHAQNRDADLWMYHAMLQVTPASLYRSKNKPIEAAMRAIGWTWPVAGLSILAIAGGLFIVAMGRTVARGTESDL